jgi:predicted GTPase
MDAVPTHRSRQRNQDSVRDGDPDRDLLRFITCGSVDDGKSTLIGRLLHDSKLIFEDQLAALDKAHVAEAVSPGSLPCTGWC